MEVEHRLAAAGRRQRGLARLSGRPQLLQLRRRFPHPTPSAGGAGARARAGRLAPAPRAGGGRTGRFVSHGAPRRCGVAPGEERGGAG